MPGNESLPGMITNGLYEGFPSLTGFPSITIFGRTFFVNLKAWFVVRDGEIWVLAAEDRGWE